MIKAARSAETGVPAAPKVVLPTKPLPGKAPAKAEEVPRRSVLSDVLAIACAPVVIAWTSFFGSLGAATLGLARFMMPNVLVEPPTKFKIGPPTDYAPGTVSTKWQAQFNIWVVNAEVDGVRSIYALSTVCTHLGCTPNWLEGEQKFKCPCHGSGFYKSGINFEGPAPRPLERVGLRLSEDGMLEVDKSVKFQRELGQWTNPSSFVGIG
jgi:cytochrome b6-f complex iron-sulfur subunit